VKTLLPLLLTLSIPGGAGSEDRIWNWRGPNRDGLSPDTGLLKAWPAGGPPLAWKITGIGAGHSGVSVSGDRLFTMGDGEDASYLRCLAAPDGKILWSSRVGKTYFHKDYPGPRCTPATDGKLVIGLGYYGELVCVQAYDGKEVWRKSLKDEMAGRVGGWGYSESPLLDGDRVVLTPGGKKGTVLALKKATGEPVWQSAEFTDSAEYASLVPTEIGGVRQYVVLTMQSVAGIAVENGKLLWRAARRGSTAVCTTPVCRDGIVFVTSAYNVGCSAFKVSAEAGRFKAEPVYVGKFMANHHGGVILVGDHLYGFDDGVAEKDEKDPEKKKTIVHSTSGFKCFELKTGKEIWSNRSVGKGSIAYADGLLFVRSQGGPIALVEATPSEYKERGRFNQPDRSRAPSWPHPVIFGGRMYIRDQDVLLCYDVKAK
jgi:outer membrane protein assembly factor BamB